MEGKVAVITGAAKGLGRAFAEILLREGVKVCLCDINTENGRRTEKMLQEKYSNDRVFFMKCDATVDTELESTLNHVIERYGGIDILCNNAGIINEMDWKKTVAVNLSAVIHGTLLGLRYMGKAAGRPHGVIINIASVPGAVPMSYGPVYTASKQGVVGFTHSVGFLSPNLNDVCVNCLCPTFVNADILKCDESAPDFVCSRDAQLVEPSRKMFDEVGIMGPEEVAESFLELVMNESLSGAGFLITRASKSLLRMPLELPELFDKYSSL
ncbi:hypothetical protein LSH36_184g08001 [Paralvinella palmiformis]|uniref:15-hydroxyprostaglandin dehydrogenase [NAD(+)] n=1 Tax=Paralvinella palmiformis TaxID=53620 RepID=A0AAD9JRE4_9ANNE|nr:hypothetical protein LSH36_184g08001 [Paralvinella palmiformis]